MSGVCIFARTSIGLKCTNHNLKQNVRMIIVPKKRTEYTFDRERHSEASPVLRSCLGILT